MSCPSASSLFEILAWRARHHPDRIAYVFLGDDGSEAARLTYGELDQRARGLACVLQESACEGERVLLLLPPGLDFVAAFFACLYAGAIAVPAYPPRLGKAQARMRSVVCDAQPSTVLTSASIRAKAAALIREVPELASVRWLTATEGLSEAATERWRDPRPESGTVAFLQYTSGSTAEPKGVMVSHDNLLHNQEAIRQAFGQSEESVIVGWLPLYHDMGLIGNVLQTSFVGARCILMSPMTFLQRPGRWLEAISRYGGTTSGGPNFAYDLCVRQMDPAGLADLDLSRWTVAFNGAEPVRAETQERFAARFAPCGFRPEAFYPCYGLAEGTLFVSGGSPAAAAVVEKVQAAALDRNHVVVGTEGEVRRLVGCGQAWAGQKIAVVDPESRLRLPADTVGEIWVSGASVAQGYWQRPEETERVFQGFLADSGDGPFLRTGDLGFVRRGELFVTGRIKDLLIFRGRNHYPQDIEQTVERSHPALRRGCGAAVSVSSDGEERLVVIQEVERRAAAAAAESIEEIARAIRGAVSEEHEVPLFDLVLVQAGTIPKTSSGKIRRHACRAAYLAGELAVVARPAAIERDRVLPRTPTEQTLARIWSDLLDVTSISIGDHFFELGGDSLLSARLVACLRETLGVELTVAAIFERPTLAALAEWIDGRRGHAREPALRRREPGADDLPLSFSQERLWFLDQLDPGTPAYNIPVLLPLRGELDVLALERSLAAIGSRHEVLRTAFASAGGRPVQVIAPSLDLCLPIADLRLLAPAAREAERRRLARGEAGFRFRLEERAPWRALLFRLEDREHLLHLNFHHIAVDGWSIGVLFRELEALYRGFSSGRPAPLPELPLQYADYVLWQRSWLSGAVLEEHLAYWRERLSGLDPYLQLPLDRPRPAIQSFRGAARVCRLTEGETGRRIGALCRREGGTLYMLLLAAFQSLLHRVTRTADIAVGSFAANRDRSEVQDLIGFFVNALVLRTDLTGDPSLRELLARVREVTLGAYAHQELPFEKILEELSPERNRSHTPLFQVMLVLQNFSAAAPELPGLTCQGDRVRGFGRAEFDLTLWVWEQEGELTGLLEYNLDLFDPATASRLLDHLRRLLAGAVEEPEARLSVLPLMGPIERHQLLQEWSFTPVVSPPPLCIHRLFERQAELSPEALAVVRGGESLTYGALDRQAEVLASHLRSLGVGPEVRVGLAAQRSIELVVGLLGILKAGGVIVPLDPAYPQERLAFLLADSGASILATTARLAAKLPAAPRGTVFLDAEVWQGGSTVEPPWPSDLPETLAYLIYTSGSTGIPKGVAVSHANAMPLMLWSREYWGLREGTRVLQTLSYAFDFGLFEVLTTLLFGGTLYIPADGELDPTRYAAYVREHAINTVHATPSFFREVVGTGARLEEPEILHLGGEALSFGQVDRMLAAVGERCVLYNGYGPTEATVNCLIFRVGSRLECDDAVREAVPIGRPSAENAVYILDDAGEPVAVGVPGELYVGGPGVARGYLGRPALTAERFVPDRFHGGGGARLYKTGDLARYLPDGNIEFLGRSDDQVKIRGFRIELGEIEAALAGHPKVAEAAVLARAGRSGESQLVAYVVPANGIPLSSGELRAALEERLPRYMVPSGFVFLPEIHRTPSGKLDRRALPALGGERPDLGRGFAPPQTAAEEVLAGIWAEVLGLDQVGIHDDFFELGGHSLLATQIIARVREAFAVELPLVSLFEASTVAALAERLGSAGGVEVPPIVPVPRDQDLPVSFSQERIWFLTRLEPDLMSYHVPRAVRLRGPFQVAAMEWAFTELIRRHEVLRTSFPTVKGRPVQRIHPARPMKLPVVDLRALPEAEREEELGRLVLAEGQRLFDLEHGPLLRAAVFHLGPDQFALAQTEHHLVHDGWAEGVLVGDLLALYTAFAAGQPSPLPELPVQYADFASWQRQWLQGEVVERQLAYWRERLTGAPPVLDLPADRPRPSVQSFGGGVLDVWLPAAMAGALQTLSRRRGVTLFMTMLAAFKAVLYRHTVQPDLVVGSGVANRRRQETEGMIGMVINTIALRTDLGRDPGFHELLARVREVCLGAYSNQDVPFEQVVEALRPARNLGYAPIFQVLFAFHDAPYPELRLPGLAVTELPTHNLSAKFDLVVITMPGPQGGGGIRAHVEYATDLFDRPTIERLWSHLEILLGAVADGCDAPLAELPLLGAAERSQLLIEWNDARGRYPRDACIHELFEARAALAPNALAVAFDDQTLTYRELNRRSNQLAHHLRAYGVGPDVLVAMAMHRSADAVVGLLGILKAGGAYVPLDPAYPPERLAFMLRDTRSPVLVTSGDLLDEPPGILVVHVDHDAEEIARRSERNPESRADAQNLAYVTYTSGSTGVPKGVCIPHRAVCRLLCNTNYVDLPSTSSVAQIANLAFDAATFELWGPLLHGGCVVGFSQGVGLTASGLAALGSRERIGAAFLTTALFNQIASEAAQAFAGIGDLLFGGEAVDTRWVRRVLESGGPERLIHVYGPTESTTFATWHRVEEVPAGAATIPIGRPLSNTRVYVVDPQMRSVPVGVPGELYLGGDGLARGYWNRPDLTAEKFVPDPFSREPGGVLYRTGDLVRWRSGGSLEFLGRIDGQIKLRGFRVELGEIEANLLACPGVDQAVVVARENETLGRHLVAYLVARAEPRPAPHDLRRFLQEKLPRFMVPSFFSFLDALPLTANGKLDRKALPDPEGVADDPQGVFKAPESPTARELEAIWSEVLGRSPIGIDEDFFSLGGHSLLVTRMLTRVQEVFRVEVPLRQFWEAPTIAALELEITRRQIDLAGADTVLELLDLLDGRPTLGTEA
ncbi:MAG: hypothetical protein QOH06_3646 [Acidobacteriota bacterium]|jgi:amino acid adenylation domain-containing protein|nr:hypothetical protein [Acidobacteriota bacterium]